MVHIEMFAKKHFVFVKGNFMYFIAKSPYMVLGSRLVAGLGSGSGSSIFGMISRTTTTEERTAAFSRLMSLRQIGLIIGPACNLLLEKLDFYIGPFHVNSFTVPGVKFVMFSVICLNEECVFRPPLREESCKLSNYTHVLQVYFSDTSIIGCIKCFSFWIYLALH